MAKSFTFLALAALIGLATADAPFTCSKALPGPPESTCAKTGFLSGEDGKLFAVEQLSLEECAAYCAGNENCHSVSYRDTQAGRCVLYGMGVGELEWNSDDFAWDTWYDVECFSCDKNALLDVDFATVENLDDWSLPTEYQDILYYDAQSIDGKQVLRVLELADSGVGSISYSADFPLEAGATYRLGFGVKTNKPDETDFSKLEMYVAAHDELIFEYSPEDGSKTGQVENWGYYAPEFTVQPVDAGQGTFELSITANGNSLDWYFSYVYLQKV